MTTTANPVLVNHYRGDLIESQHRGSIAVCDPAGRIVKSWGDFDRLVYPRSSIKALQAIPLIETGAADSFKLSNAEIALACSSHGGESFHVSTVSDWLKRLNLSAEDLECGSINPLNSCSVNNLVRHNREPERIHNTCSGKHAGMINLACHLKATVKGYIDPDHPVQQLWIDCVSQMTGANLRKLPVSFDGCGIPVFAIPLKDIATAFARFAKPDELPQIRANAIDKITEAVSKHPEMVAGTDRVCTEVMQITGKQVFVKTGAEGVYTAAIPEAGLGIALKIDDGDTSASEVALLAVLKHLGCLKTDELEAIQHKMIIPIKNTRNVLTGYQTPSAVFD